MFTANSLIGDPVGSVIAPQLARVAPIVEWNGFEIIQNILDVKAAFSAKVPGIGSADVDVGGYVLHYMMMMRSENSEPWIDDGEVFVYKGGVGIHIVVRVFEIKVDFNLNFSSINIASSSGLARSELKTKFQGLNATAFSAAPGIGVLQEPNGIDKVVAYIDAVRETLVSQNDLQPARRMHQLGAFADSPKEVAASVAFAVQMVVDGNTIQRALKNIGNREIDFDIVRDTYASEFGILSDTTEPNGKQRKLARNWF